jgi:hypothetical protein
MLLPLLAVATSIVPGAPQSDTRLLGWTGDGHALVWVTVETAASMPKHYYLPGPDDDQIPIDDPKKLSAAHRARMKELAVGMMGDEPQTDERARIAVVHDVRRGEERRYLLSYEVLSDEGRAHPVLKKRYGGLPTTAAFEAWRRDAKVGKVAGRRGPRGAATIDVKYAVPDGVEPDAPGPEVTWTGETLSWTVDMSFQTLATLKVTCGPDVDHREPEQPQGSMYTPAVTGTPYWDPTGHRVVFALEEAVAKTMRGPDGGRHAYELLACGPQLEVVAPPGQEAIGSKIADALEATGATVVSIGPAKGARPTSVVYADAAHAALAAKVAAAIPGGATVDKLTWKAAGGVVVAIGDSAK